MLTYDEITKKASLPPPAATNQPPQGLDPAEGIKNMARDAANAVRGAMAPQPAPTVAPLMGPDAGSTILPHLQRLDAHMRERTAAVPGLLADAGRGVASVGQGIIAAGQAENQRIQALDASPKNPGTVAGGISNFLSRVTNAGLDAGVFDPELKARQPILTPEQQRAVAAPAPAAAASAPTTAASATPAVAAPATPPKMTAEQAIAAGDRLLNMGAGTKTTPEQQVQLQSLISAQNSNRTPVSDPYSGPAAAGMPAPGGVAGSIGVAGYQAQLNNIRALGGGSTEAAPQYVPMPDAAPSLQKEVLDNIAGMRGISTRERARLMASVAGGADNTVTNRRGQDVNAATAAQGNSTTRRGQDITAATAGMQTRAQMRGQDLAHQLGMAGHAAHKDIAALNADVSLAGQANQAGISAASNDAALARAQVAADASKEHTKALTTAALLGQNAFKPTLDPRFLINGAGDVRYIGDKLGMKPPGK